MPAIFINVLRVLNNMAQCKYKNWQSNNKKLLLSTKKGVSFFCYFSLLKKSSPGIKKRLSPFL